MNNIDKMRPIDMHNRALLLREQCGVEFYLKENSEFIDIDCPVCKDDKNSQLSFYKYGFKHMTCTECKTLYVSPRPVEKKLFEYYDSYEAPKFWNNILVETNNDRKYLQHTPRVEILKNIVSETNNKKELFVDLGAGNGNFSKAILEAEIFKEVIASDISDTCLNSCREQGLETKKGTVNDFSVNSIDCITFNDLIEHVFNPYDFLSDCYAKLRENGILMLSTPNGEGFDFKILKDKTENITPPEHIQYFNPNSIKILLEKIGFEIVSITTPGILDTSIIKRQINEKNFSLKKNNDFLDFIYSLNDEEVESDFQNFLQRNNLSSHMLIFAKKI